MPKQLLDKDNNLLYSGYETEEIVANPQLDGTEGNLTGLQVGDTKYAVPQGGEIEFVELSYNNLGGTITQEQATALLNGAWVKMTDLAVYPLPMLPSFYAPADGLLHFATALETTGRGEIYFREIIVDTQNLTYTVLLHRIQPYSEA